MATLRDMGLEPRTFDSAPVLRDAGLVPRAAPDVTELVDQASANSMGQLRRGFSTGLLNADANAMAADESSLRAQGRSEEADGLRSRIGALQQRALTFAPKEQDVTQLNWEPGRVLDYGLGAVGQGAASMLEPAGAAVGLAAAGRVLGAIPTAPTRLLGGALRLGAPAAAGYLNFRQGKGEFYNDAAEDPTIMAGKTAEEINQSANLSGALSGVIDTAFPAVAAERIAGRAGMKALAKAGMPAKIGLDLAGEGATEVGQGEIKRHLLTDANPLRDTSGDTADRWNDFVGGILGAGPLSAASHLASKGHARLGVADDPNNDVSGKGTTDKAEPKAGDSFSDVLRRGTSERKARAGSDAEVKAWKDTLEGLGSDDPLEGATLQHAALVKELSGRVAKGEAGAQQHLDAVSAENPDDPLQMAEPAARDAAAKYLIGDGSDEEAIKKVMKAYEGRKLNTQVDYGDLGGRTGAGEPIAQNDPARAESIARYREMGQRARLTADVLTKALPEAKKKYAKVAASLGQELAHFSGEGYEKPSAGDTARVLRMGAQLVHLYGGEKAHALVTEAGRTANIEGTKLFKALNASVSVAREDVGAYQKAAATSREAAADQLVRALPPDAELRLRKDGHDLTDPGTREHLLGMVEDVFDGTGMSEKALREAIGDKAFEAVREVVGQPIEPRKKTDKQTEETVDATDTPETKTPTESDEDTGDAGLEDGDTWAQEGAKKNVEKAPGSKVYFSRGLEHGIGATDGHPFKADKKTGKLPWLSRADDRLKMKTDKAGERTGPNTLDDMMAKAYESLGGTYGKIVSETKRPTKERDQYGMLRNRRVRENIVPGEVKADDDTAPLGVGAHRIRTISAKEAMDDHKVGKDERVDLMREYAARMGEGRKTLPKDDPTIMQLRTTERRITKLEKAEPKELVTGVSKAGAATKPNPKRAELDALKSQHAEAIAELARKVGVEPKEGMTVAGVADAYFSDHFMVVAEHMAEKDQLRLEPAEVTAMIRRGNNDLDYAQQFEAAGTREKVEADMNLIRFKSDKAVSGDGIAVIRASALVKWVRDNRNEFNKRETNTSTSTAIDFRNDLMEGIGALAAGGYMPHLPYMVNAVGKKESFGNGFPPSLKLETTTQAKLNKGRDTRVKDRLENGDPEIEGPVDQEAVAREQNVEPASDRNTDADELLPEGRERKRLKINPEETAYGARLKPKGGQLDLPGVTPSEFPEGARYWDAPSAPASEAATPTNPAADERKFVGPQPQSKERRRYPVAPETVDTRSAHEGRVASELEPRKQRQGAVPIDRTELAMRNAVQDAALDKVDTLTPSNAIRKGTELAASIWGAFRTDPREAFLRLQRVANALSAEAYPDPQSNKPAGGKHYAAALAPILTPFRIDKLVASAKNPTKARATLEAMRTQTAAAIATAGDEIASGDKLKLARMLMGDPNASISAARKYLGETQRMTVKAEPVAKVAPKVESAAVPGVTVVEHPSPNYGPRTKHNADSAGLTVAIASDFSTAGEKLTARVSEGKYLGIPLDVEPAKAGVRLAKAMRALGTTTLNVAGNGSYTLAKSGMTQQKINQHVYDTLAAAHALLPITKIVTGGQTGVDIAGAIAAKALSIPTVVTMPGGFKQRGVDQKDTTSTAAGITQQILDGAAVLMVEQEVNKRAAADSADKASAWAAKQLTGDASTIAARNALLKRLGERMAGMTNAQVDALYDAVSNDDVPEGVHKAVWSQAAELARLESDKRDAAARKAEIEGEEPAPTRKLNTQLNPAAHLSATVQAVAQTRSLMRLLGFKSAPAQFASVAEKLLTDPTQNPDAFIKESAQALSHLLVRTDAVKAAMKGVAWAQERTRLIAKLTGQGMGRIAAQEAAFQTLVGEVLAEELKARTAAERASAGTIFGAAKSFVSAFKRMATTNEFTEVVRAELNKLIEKAHNPERLKEGFAKVTFQAAVDADPQAAAVLAHMAANPKAVLTGSIVLSLSGSVYRNAANMLHDLDFVMEGTHAEALAHLNKAFPNSVQVNGFAGSQGTIYTHIVPAPGAKIVGMTYKSGKATYTVERDGQVVGRSWHDADGEHKEGEAATTVDFFVGTDQEAVGVVPFKAGGKQHNVRVTSAASIFDKKMEMGRPKDMLDYVRYVPEAGRKLNTQATPAGIQSSENAAPNDDQIAAAHAYIKKVLGPKVKVEFAKDFDAAGEWVEADNLIKLALHSGPGMLTVAHHESMHALWSQLVKNSPDAASKLAHVLSSPDIRTRLEDLLHNEPTALAQLSDPEERVAYAYQFWAAGALDVDKPATTLFAKFRKFLRKVFGMVRDSETALDIMTAFHDGKLAEPSAAGRVIKGIMAREKWNEDVRRKFDATIQHVYSSVNVSNKVLRSSESADARSLGEELFSNPGEERDGQNFEGYLNARTRVVRQYTNFLYKGVKGLSQRDLEAVAEHMQLKTPLEGIHYAPVREAVKGMRALTKRYYTYATKDAGLQLEYLGDDHYPRVWDLSELVNNREKFVAMLLQPKYAKTMRSALDMVNANKNAPQKTMEDLAAMMHEELMQKNGVDEKGMETERGGNEVLSPFFASQKERSFKWLDDEDVEPFLEKDLIGAMSRYLHQGIRAAEYSRRFGNGGAALRERLAMIGDEWVNPETGRLENRTKPGRIQGELIAAAEERGITGVEADKWVARRMEDIKNSVTAHEGSLGSEISPAVRKITSAAMAYQNLRLLPLSLFAAFADPLSIAARGPGVKAGFEAFTNGLRDVWLRWKDAASDMPAERRRSMWDDMAETAGVVDSHMFLEQMGKAHTSEFMTDFARKANRALFMANGLTAWDRSMRVTATKFAALFLQDHKSLPDKHSARWLAELGLKPEDIPLDADGKLIYDRHTLAASRYSADMNADEKAAVLAQATQEIEKVHYALTRWVEGAVLTPNAAQRPTWGSDPRWAVLFHLKQFTYSFQDTVIKRAFNEASHGNMNPIGALAASVPTMMVSDILKGFVMGGGSMPAYMKTWGLGDHMMHAVSRAGLAGTSQFGLDALRDPASLFGPTVEQAIKVVTSPSEIGKNLVDAIPGARFLGPAKDLGRAMSD